MDFSLSHAGDAVMCAVSTAFVGCDVEMTERFGSRRPGFERRALHPGERKLLESLPPESAALVSCAMWTFKEALGKRVGLGISYDLPSFDFSEGALALLESPCGEAAFFAHGLHFRSEAKRGAVFACCSEDPLPRTEFPGISEIAGVVSRERDESSRRA